MLHGSRSFHPRLQSSNQTDPASTRNLPNASATLLAAFPEAPSDPIIQTATPGDKQFKDKLSLCFASLTHLLRVIFALISVGRVLQVIGGAFLFQVIAVKLSCSLDIQPLPIFTPPSLTDFPICETQFVVTFPIWKQIIAQVEALEETTSRLMTLHHPPTPLPETSYTLRRRDFALHGGGGDVIPYLTSPTLPLVRPSLTSKLLGHLRGYEIERWEVNPPHTALEDDVGVGNCWAIDGKRGHIGVQLSESVRIMSISINHVAPWLISEADSRRAPRRMVLWGRVKDVSAVAVSDSCTSDCFSPSAVSPRRLERFVRLADFVYDNTSDRRLQVFDVDHQHITNTFSAVVLQIRDNWGANSTCLYHFGVYGEIAD